MEEFIQWDFSPKNIVDTSPVKQPLTIDLFHYVLLIREGKPQLSIIQLSVTRRLVMSGRTLAVNPSVGEISHPLEYTPVTGSGTGERTQMQAS